MDNRPFFSANEYREWLGYRPIATLDLIPLPRVTRLQRLRIRLARWRRKMT